MNDEYICIENNRGYWIYVADTGEAVAFCSCDADNETYQEFIAEVFEDFGIIMEGL